MLVTKRTKRPWLILAALSVAAAVGCGDDRCSAVALQEALDAARPGEIVAMGACRVEGSLRVPAGVTLAGRGTAESVLAPSGPAVIELEPGDPPASINDLTVEASSVAGVASITGSPGPGGCTVPALGGVSMRNVVVRARSGFGVYFRCVERVELEDVRVEGPVTPDWFESTALGHVVGQAPAPGATCDGTPATDPCVAGETRETSPPDCAACGVLSQVCDPCGRWATITAREGVVLRSVTDARLTRVEVSGLAAIGVTVADTTLRWSGGGARGQLGVGLHARASMLDLDDVSLSDNAASPWRLALSLGAFIDAGSSLVTTDVRVENNAGFGMLQSASTADHTALLVRDNADTGVWVGGSPSMRLAGSMIVGNELAGVVLSSCEDVAIEDTTIAETRVKISNRASGTELGRVRAGDGLHVRDMLSGLRLERVALENNEVVGLLLDLGAVGATPDFTFQDVTVRGTGAELGAIAGRTVGTRLVPVAPGPDDGWDAGIAREGAPLVNDAAWTGELDIVGIVAPTDVPDAVEAAGLVGPMD